jgi:hypothetical protein
VGGSFQWIALTPNKGREGLEGVVAIPVFVVGTAAVISQRYQFGEILVTLRYETSSGKYPQVTPNGV